MPSSKEYCDYVLDQLSLVKEITSRKMMGEYILYCKGKIFGGIYDDRFLVKKTPFSKSFMQNPQEEIPYEDANPMFLVEEIDNKEFLQQLVNNMLPELPEKKNMKSKDKTESTKLTFTEFKYFRVHTQDIAYITQQPRGLFAAIGKLVDNKVMSEEEIEEYWANRKWFEANLPVPTFYDDGNTVKAITWYKNNSNGNDMYERMTFYLRMAKKYGLKLFKTTSKEKPGEIIYEDDYQIGVVNSLNSGIGFTKEELI
ncbi:MAG: hypothetical protein GX677_10885 [Treponema sp.]|nr:hypothetical protein [Treponema sp.]